MSLSRREDGYKTDRQTQTAEEKALRMLTRKYTCHRLFVETDRSEPIPSPLLPNMTTTTAIHTTVPAATAARPQRRSLVGRKELRHEKHHMQSAQQRKFPTTHSVPKSGHDSCSLAQEAHSLGGCPTTVLWWDTHELHSHGSFRDRTLTWKMS